MSNQITVNRAEYELLKEQSARVKGLEEQTTYLKADFGNLKQRCDELNKANEQLKSANEDIRKSSENLYREKCRLECDIKRANRIIDALIFVMEGNK